MDIDKWQKFKVMKKIELNFLMRQWNETSTRPDFNPTPTLNKISEIWECFPKPHQFTFDALRIILKSYEQFMVKLIMDYLNDKWSENLNENKTLNIAACRLIMSIKDSFTRDVLRMFYKPIYVQPLKRLINYAKSHFEPLHTCATSLLAIILEDYKIVHLFRDDLLKLHPIVLNRLRESYKQLYEEKINHLRKKSFSHSWNSWNCQTDDNTSVKVWRTSICNTVTAADSNQNMEILENPSNESEGNGMDIDHDLSSLASSEPVDTLVLNTKIINHLKFIISCGNKKILGLVFNKNNLYTVMEIIKLSSVQNRYLTLLTFKYLRVLLCYNSYVIEFFNSQGLQKLLSLPKSFITDEYVITVLHNLSCSEENMQQVCGLPREVLVDLVKYVLSMLELPSTMSNAMGFFANSFRITVIHEIFDNHDGLHKLINAIASRIPLSININHYLKDTEKQFFYNFCWSLKEYFEAHLHIKVQQSQRAEIKMSSLSEYKLTKTSSAVVDEEIELLSNILSKIENWTPVDQLIQFGGLNLILIIIKGVQRWVISNSYVIVSMAFKVLNVCAALPKFRLILCEPRRIYQGDIFNNGLLINDAQFECASLDIVIKVAQNMDSHVCVRKEALFLLKTCVCAPIYMSEGSITNKNEHKTYDGATIEKIWNSIRNFNGIMFLLASMQNRTPDEDVIRGLASCALARIARSESVLQMFNKLPFFKKDKLKVLMVSMKNSEPFQKNSKTFQKNVSELMELIHDNTKHNATEIAHSSPSIRWNNQYTNFAIRYSKNIHSRRFDQKLVHSRFCPTRIILGSNPVHCKFLNQNRIAVGTISGSIKVFNLFRNVEEELSFVAHPSFILNMDYSNDERLLVSSFLSGSSLWSKNGESMSLMYSLSCKHYTFSNHCSNILLGTDNEIATIHDVETRTNLMTLNPKYSNHYYKNKATFNPSDKLVLSDGVLWDAISGKEIHKFDKLHTCISGIFHPFRFEIISNTEVWDLRTFKLLSDLPHIDKHSLIFPTSGEGMYAYIDFENYKHIQLQPYFKTLDPWDYSLITTIDVDSTIYHMAINKNDTQIAVIENPKTSAANIIDIYDVGRSHIVEYIE